MRMTVDASDWLLRPSLAMAIENFNAEMTHIQHDLAQEGVECGPGSELVQVRTPWAMGLVDEQGVSLV